VNLPVAELIGLVTGGRSGERDRSLLSAEAVGEALDRQGLKLVRLDLGERDFADRVPPGRASRHAACGARYDR